MASCPFRRFSLLLLFALQVLGRALDRIRQAFVGRIDLLEHLLRFLALPVLVGVPHLGQPSVGLLDVVSGR